MPHAGIAVGGIEHRGGVGAAGGVGISPAQGDRLRTVVAINRVDSDPHLGKPGDRVPAFDLVGQPRSVLIYKQDIAAVFTAPTEIEVFRM